jgi:predicted dehydrogenase
VGLGSIGTTHLKNLQAISGQLEMQLRVDVIRICGNNNVTNLHLDNIYCSFDEITTKYDAVFITNPPHLHYSTLERLLPFSDVFFIEKPIFDKLYNIQSTKNIYVACPLRYHPAIEYLQLFTKRNSVISFRAICSTYLPSWPNRRQKYQNYYSASKDTGGGVELDLIHEIDYIKWIFGKPLKTKLMSGQFSSLEITSNDVAIYLLEFERLIGSLHIDYFGKYKNGDRREIEVFTNDGVFLFDIQNNFFKTLSGEEHISFEFVDIHKKEMMYFINLLLNKEKNNINKANDALDTLSLASGISL